MALWNFSKESGPKKKSSALEKSAVKGGYEILPSAQSFGTLHLEMETEEACWSLKEVKSENQT